MYEYKIADKIKVVKWGLENPQGFGMKTIDKCNT